MKHAIIEDSTIKVMEFFHDVGRAAKREKQSTIALNQMMYWWTRKPLVVGQAIALSSVFDNISDVKAFLRLDSQKPYDHMPDLGLFRKKLGTEPSSITVLDPLAGSGNLIFPAIQLGLDVTSSDYNPLAWLIERCTLEYPVKYGRTLRDDFIRHADKAIQDTKREIGRYFDDSHLTYLWSWCIRCPHCSQRFPLMNHMYVVRTPKRKIGVKIVPKDNDFTVKLVDDISDEDGKKFTQKGGKAVCISCTNTIQRDVMANDIAKYRDREMIAIQIQKKKGRDYVPVTEEHKKRHDDAAKYFEEKREEFLKDNLIPQETILAGYSKKNALWDYGITTWDQYFDERQMLVLCTFMRNIRKTCNTIRDKSHQRMIATYLAFILAKRVDNAGFGVIWDTGSTKPTHLLAMRQPGISYNFAESNPFEKINGSIVNIIQSISRSLEFAVRLQTAATCKNQSVTKTSNKQYDLIITDPPYGHDVQYGEMSEFFYVWVCRVLCEHYEIPPRVPLDEDFCESQGRFASREKAKGFFGAGLKKSFKAISHNLKDDGIAVIFFAHSSTKAWNQFLVAVQEARLRIVSSYAIYTEMPTNVLARNKTSFMSSIVVTCRKITGESVRFFEDLIPQIDDSVKKVLDGIPDRLLLQLPITDLLIMVYGKVLEVSTQHTKLKSYAKDFVPDFEMLIKHARTTIMRQLVVKLLKKQPDLIGFRMSFYIINKIFNGGQVVADEAIKIAQAYNTTLNLLEKDGVTMQKDGLTCIRPLVRKTEYKPDEIEPSNLHEQLCYLASNIPDVTSLLHHDHIKKDALKDIVDLLIKYYNLKRNRGDVLNKDDSSDLDALNSIADHMGLTVAQDGVREDRTKGRTGRTRRSMGDEKQSRLGQWK